MMAKILCRYMTAILALTLALLVGCSQQDPLFIKAGAGQTAGQRLVVMPFSAEINVATTRQYRAFLVDLDANTITDVSASASWSSSQLTNATVDASGRAMGVAAGDSRITAKYGALSSSAELAVSDEVIAELVVTPPQQTAIVGVKRQFTAIARFADNRTQDVTNDAVWTVINTGIASVDGGLVSALAQGSSGVSASLLGQAGSAVLVVLNTAATGLHIDPPQSTLAEDEHQSFTAWLELSSGEQIDVTEQAVWASTGATIFTISNLAGSKGSGFALAPGNATVLASVSFAGTTFVDQAAVEVIAPTLTSLVVTPAKVTVPVGTSGNYTATAYYSDNTARDVTRSAVWTSENPGIASVIPYGTQRGSASGLSVGETTIRARFGGLTDGAKAIVTSPVINTLIVTPAQKSLPVGLTTSYYATAMFSDGSSKDVTLDSSWSSSDQAVAVLGNDGTAHASSTGNVTVKAVFAGLQADAQLRVTAPTLIAVEVTPVTQEIPAGTHARYMATGIYSDNSSVDITDVAIWSSSDEVVAIPGNEGVVLGKTEGTATISAMYQGLSDSASLVVHQGALVSLLVLPKKSIKVAGSHQQYTATGIFTDHIANLTAEVSWISSNNAVATISNNVDSMGRAYAVSSGNVVITANYKGVLASASLTVKPAVVTSLQVKCLTTNLPAGFSMPCDALATYSNGRIQSVRQESQWTSANTAVASVQNAGATTLAGLVAGKVPGTVAISATFAGVSDSQVINVTNAVLQSINVVSANAVLQVGDQEQFFAEATFSDSSSLDVTETSLWQSGNNALLAISNDRVSKGLGTALAVGALNVTAQYNGSLGTSPLVTIVDGPFPPPVPGAPDPADVRKVQILCDNATSTGPIELNVGDIDRCKAWASMKNGTSEDVTAYATWSIDKPAIATGAGISADNYFELEGIMSGDTILRAEYGKKAVINIKVY